MGRQTYTMNAVDGVYTFDAEYQDFGRHQLSCSLNNNSSQTGVVNVQVLSPGGQSFESFPSNSIDLSAYKSILLLFCVEKFQFTLTGFNGSGQLIFFDSIL